MRNSWQDLTCVSTVNHTKLRNHIPKQCSEQAVTQCVMKLRLRIPRKGESLKVEHLSGRTSVIIIQKTNDCCLQNVTSNSYTDED